MIYRAGAIQSYRVEFSTAENHFLPTNDFGASLSDLQVLSHINEDQSMMHQYPNGAFSPTFQSANMHFGQFAVPSMCQTTTTEQQGSPSVAMTSPTSGYDSSCMASDISAAAFSTGRQLYDVSTPDTRHNSLHGAFPAPSSFFHPPMLVPAPHCSSPLATSPLPSASPGPSPRTQELQIRMSQSCYEMGQRDHEIVPFKTVPFKK